MDLDDVVPLVLACVLLAVIGSMAWVISAYRCEARWERSGMHSEFRLFSGCLVQTEHGWIPDDRFREVSP